MENLIKKAIKSKTLYDDCCNKLAYEAQKYIDWDDSIKVNYIPGDGLCILAVLPDGLVPYYIGPEVVCPAYRFLNFVKRKSKITAKEFRDICV